MGPLGGIVPSTTLLMKKAQESRKEPPSSSPPQNPPSAATIAAGREVAAGNAQVLENQMKSLALPQQLSYGTWPNTPFTIKELTKETTGFENVETAGDKVYWVAAVPKNKGMRAIFTLSHDGKPVQLTPDEHNVHSGINGYGGAGYQIVDTTLYYYDIVSKQIHAIKDASPPEAVTPPPMAQKGSITNWRYGELIPSGKDLICIEEAHQQTEGNKPSERLHQRIVRITQEGPDEVLAEGNAFYRSLSLSPDGKKLAFITYNDSMPWFDTELHVIDVKTKQTTQVAGHFKGGETLFQPTFGKDGKLYFVSDRGDKEPRFANLWCHDGEKLEQLTDIKGDILALQWTLRTSHYAFQDDNHLLFASHDPETGFERLAQLNVKTKEIVEFETPETAVGFDSLRESSSGVTLLEKYWDRPPALVRYDIHGNRIPLQESLAPPSMKEATSKPIHLHIPTSDNINSKEHKGKQITHAYLFPPTNKKYEGLEGEKPPTIVMAHGGPTAKFFPSFDKEIQYWTSRGFQVLHVDYRGSVGYGRDYRFALNGEWGVRDVADCVIAARHLVDKGMADPEKMAIRGRSAGGKIVFDALVQSDVFKAGLSCCGISSMQFLAEQTHAFEQPYMPFLAPKETWDQRSPINFTDKINAPVLISQGTEDRIVPQNQATDLHRKLGHPSELNLIKEAGHKMESAEHLKQLLENELNFLQRKFGQTKALA